MAEQSTWNHPLILAATGGRQRYDPAPYFR